MHVSIFQHIKGTWQQARIPYSGKLQRGFKFGDFEAKRQYQKRPILTFQITSSTRNSINNSPIIMFLTDLPNNNACQTIYGSVLFLTSLCSTSLFNTCGSLVWMYYTLLKVNYITVTVTPIHLLCPHRCYMLWVWLDTCTLTWLQQRNTEIGIASKTVRIYHCNWVVMIFIIFIYHKKNLITINVLLYSTANFSTCM